MSHFRRLLLIGVGLLSIASTAFAEHEEQFGLGYEDEDTPLRRPANPAANALSFLPNVPSEINLQTIRDIQDSLRKADPKTLQALKQALTDISQGKEVQGQTGIVALDLLSRIPDAEVGQSQTSASPDEAAGAAEPYGAQSPRQNSERFKGFGAAEAPKAGTGAVASSAVVVPAGTVVKLISGETTSSSPRRTTIVAAQRPNSVLKAFPYNSATEESLDDEPGVSPEKKSEEKRKRAIASLPALASGGEILPTGEGGARQVPFGPPGGSLGTFVLNTTRGAAGQTTAVASGATAQDKQRLAGAVSSFLGRFRNRARAEADRTEEKLGMFGRIAASSGITAQRAIAKAAESSVYRKFQEATVEAGFSPTESLGVYYTVLSLAWVGTFGFLAYLMRETPWLQFALAPLRRRKK